MATNEILQFATTNTGTNLLTQAEYAADSQRTIGHQPGIARSKLENKVLRQASLLAAGLAQFLANKQSTNVTDSLTADQIAAMLVEAIKTDYLRRDASNAMDARLRAKIGAPGPGNPNNAGVTFDDDTGLFSSGDGNVQLVTNGVAQIIAQAGLAIQANKQFRVPAGPPNASNQSENAGLAFAQSGDTGLFWEDTPDGISGGTLRLRMDGGTVAEFYGGMKDANWNGFTRTSTGILIQWGGSSHGVGPTGGWSVVNYPRSYGYWARTFVTSNGDGDEGGEQIPWISSQGLTQFRVDTKRATGSSEPAPQYWSYNWFSVGI